MKKLLLSINLIFCSVCFSQGYQFLGTYTSDGTPQYFVTSDVVSQETLQLIANSLPEGYKVPVYNPQYITSGYETDLILDKDAEVWVTFVGEGAGYRNVLGFYTYDINNPPTVAPTADKITIIFPNVSAAGSGGSLVVGNKVKIGSFSAGTAIGWVLLANAWNGTKVTSGLWQLYSNPNFNPEAKASDRQHNVLLKDPANQLVILGFEDIRRDYSSCDQDFNDAIFYVTASPYDAIRTENIADVSIASNVSSGNNGGLESNGDLATLIAKRNFKRTKLNSIKDIQSKQTKFEKSNSKTSKTMSGIDFSTIIPSTGMYGTETSFVSSPTDLIGITNATQVYSVDYYENTNRVAAVFATETTNGIYDHSKAICDRLNSSSLEDVRTIEILGYQVIMVKLKRENGLIEYALNFSILKDGTQNKLKSYWNIGQYPLGDYINFQIWGSSMGQVNNLANIILAKFEEQGPIITDVVTNRIPNVFVKKGRYKNGKLYLTLINKSKSTNVLFDGNKKSNEFASATNVSENLNISTSFEQDLIVDLGNVFDVGFSITGDKSMVNDALYLADGPWGLDYDINEVNNAKLLIDNTTNTEITSDQYEIERNSSASGNVKGIVNLFRNLLPGDLVFDATNYSSLAFTVQNTLPIEVVLVTEGIVWENRLRFEIPAYASPEAINLAFDKFTNPLNQKYNNEKLRGIVFSIKGDNTTFQPFSVNVSKLLLNNKTLGLPNVQGKSANRIYNYPNPAKLSTTLVLPIKTESVSVRIVDINGGMVSKQEFKSISSNNEITVSLNGCIKGVYMFVVTTKENNKFYSKFIVE
ncbi:Secretion system C-terminal sorting domain [Flavobacteriaceae bacterium]